MIAALVVGIVAALQTSVSQPTVQSRPLDVCNDPAAPYSCTSVDPVHGISGMLSINGVQAVYQVQVGRTDGCATCRWDSFVACNSQSDDTSTCDQGGQRICTIGQDYVEVEFGDDATPMGPVAHYCRDPANPPAIVTGADATAAAADSAFVLAPDPGVASDPSGSTLAQLPTYFSTAPFTPGSLEAQIGVKGLSETLTLDEPVWHWSFGDGATLDTSSPGGRYPDGDVRHTYRVTGTWTVTLSADYRRSYVVHTPFGDLSRVVKDGRAVAGPAQSRLVVRDARARLTGGD